MIAETSRAAYQSLKKLGDKQQTVFDALKELGRASNEQLAEYLGWPINRVTGRTHELANFGVIKVDGLTIGKSGKSAKAWVAVDPNDKKLKEVAAEPLRAMPWMKDDDERSY